MAKLVDLDNDAYATYASLTSSNANPPSRPTHFHAPPSFLNSYHVPETTLESTWSQPKKVPDASLRAAEDKAMFEAVSSGTREEQRLLQQARRDKMTKSSISLSYDFPNSSSTPAPPSSHYRTTQADHTNHLWLEDEREHMRRRFAPNTLRREEQLKKDLRASHIEFGRDGVDASKYDEDRREAERWRSTARDGMTLKGVDKDVKKHAAEAKKKKAVLQSTSRGMRLGEDKVAYTTDQEAALRHTIATKARMPREEAKDEGPPKHLRDDVGALLMHDPNF
ncbi:hypothetical protein TeGR_g8500 [Tetraparma gracilis]|uniref:Pre-mRNA-splicing factor SYF2 n=1 Tax=Tetraparma gracilis TaxID=2962635 RepID=A0ABQ6MPT7_9STRA|nr:hypothetical protein TeGR_g8500 [Tetraparma gracilis]